MFNSKKFVAMKRLGIALMMVFGVAVCFASCGSNEDKMIMECAKLYVGTNSLFHEKWSQTVMQAQKDGTMDDSDLEEATEAVGMAMEFFISGAVNYCYRDGEVTEAGIYRAMTDFLDDDDTEMLTNIFEVSSLKELAKMIYSNYAAMPKSIKLTKAEGNNKYPDYYSETHDVRISVISGAVLVRPYSGM